MAPGVAGQALEHSLLVVQEVGQVPVVVVPHAVAQVVVEHEEIDWSAVRQAEGAESMHASMQLVLLHVHCTKHALNVVHAVCSAATAEAHCEVSHSLHACCVGVGLWQLTTDEELHTPFEQASPAPQTVPAALLLQLVVLAAGSQNWHELTGFGTPVTYSTPSIEQPTPVPVPVPVPGPLVACVPVPVPVPGAAQAPAPSYAASSAVHVALEPAPTTSLHAAAADPVMFAQHEASATHPLSGPEPVPVPDLHAPAA